MSRAGGDGGRGYRTQLFECMELGVHSKGLVGTIISKARIQKVEPIQITSV